MSSVQSTVSDMTVTVKSREVQRGMLAAMGGHTEDAREHFLAAAHLELVLANDYEQGGDTELARRSRISAASCFWRAGEVGRARSSFEDEMRINPSGSEEIQNLINELGVEYPG
jgi:hypothetical protein